jgi:hypothetical protein
MSKRHLAVIFMALALSIFVVMGTVFTVKNFAAKARADKRQAEISEHAQRISGLEDYMVYYIGDPSPEVVAGIPNLTVLAPAQMNRNNMPISWSDLTFIEMDDDGNVINEVDPRDYASYMLIYVDGDVTLTEDQLEILRNCNIDNDVPLMIEGANNINAYREYIFMVSHDLGQHATSMFTPWGQPEDNVIAEDVVTGDQAIFVNDLIDVILSNAEKIDAYRVDSLVEIETEATTTVATEATEETEETEETETTDEA